MVVVLFFLPITILIIYNLYLFMNKSDSMLTSLEESFPSFLVRP